MTRDDQPLETGAEFADALRALVRRAHVGGVGVEGGWVCRTDGEFPDWDVVVTELEPSAGAEPTHSGADPEAADD